MTLNRREMLAASAGVGLAAMGVPGVALAVPVKESRYNLYSTPLTPKIIEEIGLAMLPVANLAENEDYNALVQEFDKFAGITCRGQLVEAITKHLPEQLANDRRVVKQVKQVKQEWKMRVTLNQGSSFDYIIVGDPWRIARGVYFTHVGLLRGILDRFAFML